MKAARIICLSLAAGIAGAAAAGVLFGTVKDGDGKAVSGAKVSVYGKDFSAKTDAAGKFRIENADLVDGNRYSVSVEADGFDQGQTLSAEVFDNEKDMEPIDVVLLKTEPIPAAETNILVPVEGEIIPPGMEQGMVPPDMTNVMSDDLIPGAPTAVPAPPPAGTTNAAPAAAR